MRAEVRSSLRHGGFLDWLPAGWAGAAGLLVDLKMVLKVSSAVDPVDAGAVGFNPACQGGSNGFQKPGGILFVEGFTGLQGVYAGSEKCFIGVDISQSSQKVLIQQ